MPGADVALRNESSEGEIDVPAGTRTVLNRECR